MEGDLMYLGYFLFSKKTPLPIFVTLIVDLESETLLIFVFLWF